MRGPTRVVAACLLSIWTGVAGAAVLETEITSDMAEMGCTARLTGDIVPGDLERIRPYLETTLTTYDEWRQAEHSERDEVLWRNFAPATDYGAPFFTHRLCLNSRGGSLEEALRIVAYFRENGNRNYGGIPTAIARGDRCESACAYIFFAGRFVFRSGAPHYEMRSNAILHPNGILGLHAPFLPFDDESYSREEVVSIWQVGMEAASRINRQIANGNIFMSGDLFSEMIQFPPSQMLRVQTVGEAVRWEIEVEPSPIHDGRYEYTRDEFVAALCRNGVHLVPDFVELSEVSSGLQLQQDADQTIRSRGGFTDRMSERNYSCVVDTLQWDKMSRALTNFRGSGVLRRTRSGGNCRFGITFEPFAGGGGRPLEIELPCIAAFPPDLPLAELLQ